MDWRRFLSVWALVIATAAAAHAQPSPATPGTLAPTAGPAALEASPLETYYLRDSKGQLVPVPGFTYEEFEQLLRLKRGLAAPPPPGYTLDVLSLSGTAAQGTANLQLVATIRVRDEGWVQVPLQLGKAVLRQPAKHEGPGEHFVSFDSALGGYVCWLRGADAKPHVVTLQISAAIEQVGSESRLAISLPRATESSLRLMVPSARVEAALAGGEGIVSTAAKGQNQTEITVLGPAGEVQLAWQKGREPVAPGPALLEASGDIAIKVEGESRISSDARLRVRSLGAALDGFRVRLPAGMELVPTDATGYTVQLVPAAELPGKPGGQVVEVKLPRPTSGVIEVRLLAALAPEAARQANLAPAQFDVVGAVRQRGTIDCMLEGEWQTQWKEDGSTRRLDIGSDAAAARIAARYEYFRQPCGLQLKVAARPSRVSVEPTHIVYIDAQQVRIESTLKYRLRGARAEKLEIALADWKLDRITPGELLEIVAPENSADGKLLVPLRSGVGLPTDLELKLEAHHPLDAARGVVSVLLPHPVADVVAPATVVIVPADNVELRPQAASIQGLSPDPTAAPLRILARQQSPVVYRDLGGGEPAVFAADILVRPQSLTVGGRATVRLSEKQMQIEQRLDYRIAYEPQRSFEILVPRNVLASGRLDVRLGDEPLNPVPVDDAAVASDNVRLQVGAPGDQIGLCQLVCTYSLPMPVWDRQKSLRLLVPLVMPADMENLQIGGQQVEFTSADSWQLTPDPEGVSDEFSRFSLMSPGGPFLSSRITSSPRWIIEPSASAPPSPITVSKAWVQTWLPGGTRQERAVFRLLTSQEQVRIDLPASPTSGSVHAFINAQPVAAAVRSPPSVRIDLPASARGHECVLELWYTAAVPVARGGFTSTTLEPARIEGASAPRRLFWQLCLPEDEHLLTPPGEFAAEMTWGRTDWLWGRRATLDQTELEAWIGASRQDALPRGVNEYLFSTLAQSPKLSFLAGARRWLLFVASGLVLTVGLLLMHVRAVRRPETLLIAALLLAALALAWPDAAVLLAQAATAGLVVTAALALLTWLTAGRNLWPAAPAAPAAPVPQLVLEGRSTEAPAPRPDRAGHLTTATSPAPIVAPEPQP